jgi:hypothetical protein
VSAPEELARKRWKPAAKALAKRDEMARQLREARQRVGDLSAALPDAERRERELRGRALAEGKPVSVGEAAQVAAELEDAQQFVRDLEAASEVVERELFEARANNRDTWTQSQDRAVERARSAVFAAADELVAAVAQLEDENALRGWAAEAVPQGSVDPHGGRFTHTGVIAAALDQVRAAVAGIAAGIAPQPEPRREQPGPIEKLLAGRARADKGWG